MRRTAILVFGTLQTPLFLSDLLYHLRYRHIIDHYTGLHFKRSQEDYNPNIAV